MQVIVLVDLNSQSETLNTVSYVSYRIVLVDLNSLSVQFNTVSYASYCLGWLEQSVSAV